MSESKPTEAELREKLKQVGQNILECSIDKKFSFDQTLVQAERSLLMLYSSGIKTGFEHIESHLQQLHKELDNLRSGKHKKPGLKTGLSDLDDVLAGLHAGNLYIIGGSPGMGKIALALTILHQVAVNANIPVGIFSLEMSGIQIAARLLCMEAKVDTHLVRTGNLTKSQWKDFMSNEVTLAEATILIDDTTSLSPLEIKHNAIRMKAKHDIKLLIVDYLQLIRGIEKNGSQKKETKLICRLLKTIAIELDIPVIVTSQLTQIPKKREDKRPVLSDFRHPVEIEEAADTILLLYRPWLYTLDEADIREAEVIIAKNRNGPTGIVNIRFIDKYAKFENITGFEMEFSK